VPDLDWSPERARELGDGAVALWSELLERLPRLAVSPDLRADEVRAALAFEIPDDGLSNDELLDRLRALAFELSMYPGHPGFLAYISGSGTVPGAAADLLAAALNQNGGGFRLSPGATEIEEWLVHWLATQFGLPGEAGGLFVAGGAMANFVALKVARDAALGEGARARGVADGPPLALYGSSEAHVVQRRAADMLGLGSDALRTIPVDGGYRLDAGALASALDDDRRAGVRPMAVVGTAGTTATGAIDPLPAIADLCERQGARFHVDACYGGPGVLADDLRPLLAGIERADSIAVDAHKWLYTPLLGGCVLMRDRSQLASSFAADASVVWLDESVLQSHGADGYQHGPDFSRGFPALRVWLSLLAHGRRAYARRISHDAALARYLGELVDEHPDFELVTPVSLSVCCFRYAPEELRGREERLNRLNERIMTGIHADGRVYCSNAVLGGAFCLRACIVNFRTEAEHLELLLQVAEELGRAALADAA